jgi:hypothetical protein
MTQRGYTFDSTVPAVQNSFDTGRYCAYSQTRQRFLSADVEAGDFSVGALDARLLTLTADSGTSLCLLPFRGISPTSVRVPVDLIYLDRNYSVQEIVESFPLSRVSASAPTPASVLVLPADSISSTGTQCGDQIVLCSPSEMKRRLKELACASVELRPDQAADSARESSVRTSTGRVLQWEERFGVKTAAPKAPAESLPDEQLLYQPVPLFPESQEAAPAEPAPPIESANVVHQANPPEVASPVEPPQLAPWAKRNNKPARSWLQRFFSPDSPEPRTSTRESIQGLVAYFFTGGHPVPHAVRDISSTGLYVYTDERWYPGTVVRVTLTDIQDPRSERSITLHMTVVRASDDGVGLQFVLQNPKSRGQNSDGSVIGANSVQVEQFLERARNAKSQAF